MRAERPYETCSGRVMSIPQAASEDKLAIDKQQPARGDSSQQQLAAHSRQSSGYLVVAACAERWTIRFTRPSLCHTLVAHWLHDARMCVLLLLCPHLNDPLLPLLL